MPRPIRESVDSLRPIQRNLALDFLGAFGLGVTSAMVASFLPTIARREGLEPIGLAALSATPFIAAILSVLSGRYGPRTTWQLALLRLVGAGALLLIPFSPVPTVMVAAAFLFWVSNQMSVPFQQRQWGVLYPARMRARVVGFLGSGRMGASVLAGLTGTLLADQIGGPAAVALAGAVGGLCALAFLGIRSPGTLAGLPYSPRESIRTLLGLPSLPMLAVGQGLFFGGMIAAMPLLPLINVDRLDMSLAEVGILALLTAAGSALSFLPWGALADRRGFLLPMRIGPAIGLVGLVAYTFAPSVAVVSVASFAIGISNASTDLGVQAAISSQAGLAQRAPAMSGWNAIAGVRGVIAAFSVSPLVQAGVLDLTAALLVCAAASTLGVAVFWRMKPAPTPARGRAGRR